MLWLIFAMLLVPCVVGVLAFYTFVSEVIQILLISALVALGIHRISTESNRIRRYRVD